MDGYSISSAAKQDIFSILTWTEKNLGSVATLRYEKLLETSFKDLAANPKRSGTHPRSELAPEVRTYHLWQSRLRVSAAVGCIKKPRHFIVYRVNNDGIVEIIRVLHDRMDLDRHIPDSYRLEDDS